MSHYSSGEAAIKDRECLVLALAELGYPAELHEVPQHLIGYHGDRREQVAHVIVRRKHIGGASNDIGFFFHPDGRCEVIISDFDRHKHPDSWVKSVVQKTTGHVLVKTAKKQGHRVLGYRIDEKNRIHVRVQAR